MKKSLIIISLLIIVAVGFSLLGESEKESPTSANDVEPTAIEDTITNTDELTEEEMTQEGDVEESGDMSNEAEGSVQSFTLDSFNYGYSETELRVTEGDTVTINLTNSDGFHDWVVDEFSAATEKIQAGGQTSVTFVADQAGSYEFYCSVGNHRAQGMVGTLVVEERM